MAVINTNVKALFSQAALASTARAQTVAMQQLSTGKRINSARDDAAGMAIPAASSRAELMRLPVDNCCIATV